MSILRCMMIGDLIGQPGIALFQKWAPVLKEKHKLDVIVVNGENSAPNGLGIAPKGYEQLKESGAHVITTGNHAWDCKEIYPVFNERGDLLRPINYPAALPGKGYSLVQVGNEQVAIVNLHGRVFIKDLLDCPFKAIESLLTFLQYKTKIILVDFHAEATSEKNAMGLFLDGKVSGVVGTHTHVQTADERILPQGTGFITDLGCSGGVNSVLGLKYEEMIRKITVHAKFGKFIVETKGPMVLGGVIMSIDSTTGKCIAIERIRIIDEEISKNFSTQ